MKYINFKEIDEKVLYEKLDNELEVYILRKKNFNSETARFFTNFGGLDTEFTPINETKEVKMPSGIAHFLEHKLFEDPSGISAEEYYSKTGAYVNAFTNYTTTCYYFVSTNNFEDNLNYLLDFVQTPHFTDENVEKEKGIILEEAKMCLDNPSRLFSESILSNLFTDIPYNNKIVGTLDDIKKITKEDLYTCYNTFYNPSNMKLFIVTNKKEEDVLKLVKDNQRKKTFIKENSIKRKIYNEKDNVKKDYYEFKGKINENRICYGLKIRKDNFSYSLEEVINSISMYFDFLIGSLSDFNLELKKNKIVNGNISFNLENIDNYIIVKIYAFTNKKDEFISLLEDKFKHPNLNEKDFNNLKKIMKSSIFYNLNTVAGTMDFLYNEYMFFKDLSEETLTKELNLSYEVYKIIINEINYDNKSVTYITKEDN